jgi:putative spermidine/putrescine transport system ATP-binding protein
VVGTTVLAGGPVDLPDDATVEVMIRPHRTAVLRDGAASDPAGHWANRLPGTVARIVYIGDVIQVAVDTPAGTIVAERSTSGPDWHALTVGERVAVAWSAADTLVFPPDAA